MAMLGVKVQVVFDRVSLVGADRVINDWNIARGDAGDFTDTDATNAATALQHFYDTIATGAAQRVGYYCLSAVIKRSYNHQVRFYARPVPKAPLGLPLYTKTINLAGGPGGTSLPAETALCLSFKSGVLRPEHGAGGTRPAAWSRGRIYLGPLNSSALAADGTTGEMAIASACRTDVTKAALALQTELNTHSLTWGVVSDTHWFFESAATCWVDDQPDTQRRRGNRPNVRTTQTLP
jgi:hypothetical protein